LYNIFVRIVIRLLIILIFIGELPAKKTQNIMFIHLYIYTFIHLYIYTFIHLYIYTFIHL